MHSFKHVHLQFWLEWIYLHHRCMQSLLYQWSVHSSKHVHVQQWLVRQHMFCSSVLFWVR